MTAPDAGVTLAEELRRRRTALGWTLEQVAEQAQVSVGMLSLIETGKRRPSLRSWERIRQSLGITQPLPEEVWRQQPREISDELVATLGACLATVRSATLAELAEATGVTMRLTITDVRRSIFEHRVVILEVRIDVENTTRAQKQIINCATKGDRMTGTMDAAVRAEIRRREDAHPTLPRYVEGGDRVTFWRVFAVRYEPQVSLLPRFEISVRDEANNDWTVRQPPESSFQP